MLVKLLDPSADDVRKKVVAGLQALRMFRHPGALAVTDHGVYEGRPFVVHDLPQVGSLASLLDRHRAGELELPLDKIAALVARLAEVLQAGHEEPEALVHGALRPRAVLVPDDLDPSQMVLLDAGLRNLAQDPDAPKESAATALPHARAVRGRSPHAAHRRLRAGAPAAGRSSAPRRPDGPRWRPLPRPPDVARRRLGRGAPRDPHPRRRAPLHRGLPPAAHARVDRPPRGRRAHRSREPPASRS
ncbi:MAG: hypothetical protein IPN17_38255 [Deltaproteobacteria bacterium]|nr:hypothetical protein [Deltaproteobacteria bacterium]